MTIKEVLEVIDSLRKDGMGDNEIAKSFYLTYAENKINKEQLNALLAVLGYKLPNAFWKKSKEDQIKYFM